MNFNGFLHHDGDNSSGSGNHLSSAATATISGGLAKSTFSSPRLSLCLQTNGEATRIGDVSTTRRSPESRSGSDNVEALSGDDDLDASDKPLKKKKRYHRHTPRQIQELESVFKEFPHPDEKQRLDLGRRLNLDSQQVKFWFQNRRTQMKTQIERHENSLLRLENDKLRAENMSVREAMRNPMCSHCGGSSVVPAEISLAEHHLRIENSRLKDELDRICALAGKFLNRSDDATGLHQLPNSSLKLGVGSKNGYAGDCGCGFTLVPPGFENSSPLYSGLAAPVNRTTDFATGLDQKSLYLDLGLSAMAELVKMAQTSEPLWIPSAKDKREMLNREEYEKLFAPCVGPKPDGFVSEASKEEGMVVINSLALVETLMDSERWEEMFPRIIARSSTSEIISSGMGGTRNGALHLMQAELQLLSPLVPVREVTFLRFCKQHAEGFWAVVDVSVDRISDQRGSALARTSQSCRRLPSGCLVQDMPNGYSKVTWIDHTEYDESNIHNLYRPLVSSGLALGSRRWISALQRQCKSLAILMSSTISNHNTPISSIGKKSMLKLAARMTQKFCKGVCTSSSQNWSKLEIGTIDKDVRIMTRKNIDDPGEPPGILLSAATSLWVPVSPRRLFDFLRDELLRSEWDILSNGGRMQEIANIFKGQDHSNSISLLRSTAMNSNQSSMLILQETSIDESEAIVVYAPVDIPAMQSVMNGADSALVPLLPSGFAILPYGQKMNETGSVLTVAFQILVNSLPTAKLNVESIETFNNLIYCTVQKIRAALGCDK